MFPIHVLQPVVRSNISTGAQNCLISILNVNGNLENKFSVIIGKLENFYIFSSYSLTQFTLLNSVTPLTILSLVVTPVSRDTREGAMRRLLAFWPPLWGKKGNQLPDRDVD